MGLAISGLLLGAAAAVGIIQVNPPALIAPAIAVAAGLFAAVKAALMMGALLGYLAHRA